MGILAGGIAHDFNNSMTAIMSNLEIAKLSLSDNAEAAKRLDSAELCIRRAQSLTHQLLTFAKGGEPVKKPIYIRELIKDTVDFALRGSNITCEYDMAGDLYAVEADEGQLSQAVNNLVINARQAMPSGGMLRVTAINTEIKGQGEKNTRLAPGGYVGISIEDNGPGIPGDLLAKIFDPYFTTKQNGSGLGLTTTYSIIKKHGGNITAESARTGGAAFRIFLPATGKPVTPGGANNNGPVKGAGSVLFMEDEALIAMSVADLMRKSGFDVVHVGEGETALREFKDAMDSGRPFDAVILDLTILGGMGGRETMKKLIEIDPNVKAIVASGYSNDPIMSNYMEYGFSGVVPKPYDIGQLATEINRITAMKV